MAKYRKKPVVIEAITFDELVEHGRTCAESSREGVPWSFKYKGHPITHENDDCYLIPTLEGIMNMNRGDMLITGVKGEIYPCKQDIFEATYEREIEFKIDEFNFGIRARNVLRKIKVETISQLTNLSDANFLSVKGCGHTTLREIKRKLKEHGFSTLEDK
jgi:hypothetical protein